VPIFGLGGIKPESIGSVLDCGVAGVAGIGLFQGSSYRMQDYQKR
jgi:thiamine monophosphate synthase